MSQSISGVIGFRRAGKLDEGAILPLLVPTILGTLAGSIAASRVPVEMLKYALLGTMVAMALVMLIWPGVVGAAEGNAPRPLWRSPAGLVGLFGPALYAVFLPGRGRFVPIAVSRGVLADGVVAGPRFATIFSVLALGGNFGAAAGPWLTGDAFDRTGSYASAFWLCGALSLVSILCIWMAAPRKVRLAAGLAERRAQSPK